MNRPEAFSSKDTMIHSVAGLTCMKSWNPAGIGKCGIFVFNGKLATLDVINDKTSSPEELAHLLMAVHGIFKGVAVLCRMFPCCFINVINDADRSATLPYSFPVGFI
jgi:hypothetical protein